MQTVEVNFAAVTGLLYVYGTALSWPNCTIHLVRAQFDCSPYSSLLLQKMCRESFSIDRPMTCWYVSLHFRVPSGSFIYLMLSTAPPASLSLWSCPTTHVQPCVHAVTAFLLPSSQNMLLQLSGQLLTPTAIPMFTLFAVFMQPVRSGSP